MCRIKTKLKGRTVPHEVTGREVQLTSDRVLEELRHDKPYQVHWSNEKKRTAETVII